MPLVPSPQPRTLPSVRCTTVASAASSPSAASAMSAPPTGWWRPAATADPAEGPATGDPAEDPAGEPAEAGDPAGRPGTVAAPDPEQPPPWALFTEQALTHATVAPHGPGERVRQAPDMGPEGRLAHPLWPFLVAADIRFAAEAHRAGTAPASPAPHDGTGGPAAHGEAASPAPHDGTASPAPHDGTASPAPPGAADSAWERRVIWCAARARLAGTLVRLAARTLVAELRTARLAGLLEGDDGHERFDSFVRCLAARPTLVDLLCRRHPVLARLLAERCIDTVAAAGELLDRLRADRAALAGSVLDGDPGRLIEVRFGLGDPHAGGRGVAELRFEGGRTLVYKPRPLGLHARWNDLLDWFGARCPDAAPRGVRVLPRDGYGWTEFAAAGPCGSPAEVVRFYERLGAQLALLHAVDAVDIHAENVVAAGAHPVVVDVETLFHPWWTPAGDGGADPAAAVAAASVQRTAVLPNPLYGEHGWLDLSALGAVAGRPTPDALPAWDEPGTDRMRLTRRPARWPGALNRPTLRATSPAGPPSGSPTGPAARPAVTAVDPCDHLDDLLRGFRTAYRALVRHRDHLLAPGGPLSRFADQPARLVARPSQMYADLLAEATDPGALTELAARRRAFASLEDEAGLPHLRDLAPYEAADLLHGDIPLFTTTPARRMLDASDGGRIPVELAASGLSRAAAKIRALDEADLERQSWVIAASLATIRPGAGPQGGGPQGGGDRHEMAPPDEGAAPEASASWGERPLRGGGAGAAPDLGGPPAEAVPGDSGRVAGPSATGDLAGHAVALARRIGDRIEAAACHGDGRANWLGLQDIGAGDWSVLPMGMALGDGWTGTALFLAELGRLTGEARYADLAAQAVRPLPHMLRLLAGHPELAAAVGPGGFCGLGGIAYATARLAGLLGHADLAAAVPDALTALAAAAADPDAPPDIADGLAGGLLAARAVHAETGLAQAAALAARTAVDLSERVAAAEDRAGAGERVRPRVRGFLRGHDGVAYALGRPALAEPAGAEGGEGAAGAARGVGWCAGLAGAAAGTRPGQGPYERYAAAVRRAGGLPGAGPGGGHALCHGVLGMLEPLVEADDHDLLAAGGERLLREAERRGVVCGTPGAVPTPGLLDGLAGIGHGLLRLGLGTQVPSVLLLRPAASASGTGRGGRHPSSGRQEGSPQHGPRGF